MKLKHITQQEAEQIAEKYYSNNAKKLRNLVDKILIKLRFYGVDNEDFYSLADEIFIDVLKRYDGKSDFNGFLYSCLSNKFKTEMTKRRRSKRCMKKEVKSMDIDGIKRTHTTVVSDVCIDAPIGEGSDYTLKDAIKSDFDTHKKALALDKEEKYSEKMKKYLSRLSDQQREVLEMMANCYTASEIKTALDLTDRTYGDCVNAIHSYRNTKILL